MVRDNLKQIETLSKVDPLNAENKDFAASRKYLGNLEVVNENSQKIDVAPNIIEIAKLKTTSELYNTTEPLTQESYNRRLRDNIDLSIYGIMATNNWVKVQPRQLRPKTICFLSLPDKNRVFQRPPFPA